MNPSLLSETDPGYQYQYESESPMGTPIENK